MISAYKIFYKLIFKTDAAWQMIKGDGIRLKPSVFANVAILSCMLIAVVAEMFVADDFTWQKALGHLILNYLSLYAGLYLAALLIKVVSDRFFSTQLQISDSLEFATYASAFIYVSFIIAVLTGSIFGTAILSVYTYQIVSEGAKYYIDRENRHFNKFVLINGTILILSPIIIRTLLLFLLPHLQ